MDSQENFSDSATNADSDESSFDVADAASPAVSDTMNEEVSHSTLAAPMESTNAAAAISSPDPSRKRKRVDNTDSEDLVQTSIPYVVPPFPLGHRFYGLLRVVRVVDGKKNKEDQKLLKSNRSDVKDMFLTNLQPRVVAGEFKQSTAADTALLATAMWQYLGIDMWEDNEVGRMFWPYPNPRFSNSVLKALNQILNAHKHEEDKFRGIIDKMQEKYLELNPRGQAGDVKYLASGDLYRLFGIKNKKQKEEAMALQAANLTQAGSSSPDRMVQVPRSKLRAMGLAFRKVAALYGRHADYIDGLLGTEEGDDEDVGDVAVQRGGQGHGSEVDGSEGDNYEKDGSEEDNQEDDQEVEAEEDGDDDDDDYVADEEE